MLCTVFVKEFFIFSRLEYLRREIWRCFIVLSKNQRTNVFIYLCFWSLYTPLAIFEWVYSGQSSLLDLSLVLLVGLGVVLAGLFTRDRLVSRSVSIIELGDDEVCGEVESGDDEEEFDIFVGFRRLFSDSDSTFGQNCSGLGGLEI